MIAHTAEESFAIGWRGGTMDHGLDRLRWLAAFVKRNTEAVTAYLSDISYAGDADEMAFKFLTALEDSFCEFNDWQDSRGPGAPSILSLLEDISNSLGVDWAKFVLSILPLRPLDDPSEKAHRRHRVYKQPSLANRTQREAAGGRLKGATYNAFNRPFGVPSPPQAEPSSEIMSPVKGGSMNNALFFDEGFDLLTGEYQAEKGEIVNSIPSIPEYSLSDITQDPLCIVSPPSSPLLSHTISRITSPDTLEHSLRRAPPLSPVKKPPSRGQLGCTEQTPRPSTSSRYEIARGASAQGLSVSSRPRRALKPLYRREVAEDRSIEDKMKTVNGRMMAFSGELGAVLNFSGRQRNAIAADAGSVDSAIHTQGVITKRIFEESRAKNERDDVDERVHCDGYDKIAPPGALYLSTTGQVFRDDSNFESMRRQMDKSFHVKMGILQSFAEEANRLGKSAFQAGSGGFRYT